MSVDEYKAIQSPDDLLKFLIALEQKAPDLSRTEKSKLIVNLLEDLDTKPDEGEWSEELTAKAIEVLKLLGRETDITGSLFTSEGISILMKRAGFLGRPKPLDTSTSHEALKCLSNCILLQSSTKELIVERNGVEACFQLLSIPNLSMESQFLACRILFFLTVNNHELTGKLIHLDIAPVLQKVLSDNVSKLVVAKGKIDTRSPINLNSVVSEALKLLFNLMLVGIRGQGTEDPEKQQSVSEYFSKCLYPMYDYMFNVPLSEPLPLSPPMTHAINAFMQYTFAVTTRMWRSCAEVASLCPTIQEGRVIVVNRALTVLDKSISYLLPDDTDEPNPEALNVNIDATLPPLLLIIRTAAASEEEYLKLYREKLLPNAEDRKKPVHQGNTLPARLIRLMTSAMVPQTREAVCELFFVLCHEDASEFTQQVGYGNAIGFLVNRGIPVEPPQGSDPNNPGKDINPITGQYVASEQEDLPKLSEMTDEEKEREAERLFVLFERLKKTGVIDVENPVAKAMRENPERFQELDSDSDKDDDD